MTIAAPRPGGRPKVTTVVSNDGLALYFRCGPDSQNAANPARDGRMSLAIDRGSFLRFFRRLEAVAPFACLVGSRQLNR